MDAPILKQMFDKMDVNHDGKISFEEFKAGMEKAGFPCCPDKIKATFDAMDLNKDGSIQFEEFAKVFLEKVMANPKVQALLKIFKDMDKDKNGTLDKKEFAAALAKFDAHANVEEVFPKLDVNGDGVISVMEFMLFAMKQGAQCCK